MAALLGDTLAKADAHFVREQTGYAIGGVPPIAHTQPGTVLIDYDLMRFDCVFPAVARRMRCSPLIQRPC